MPAVVRKVDTVVTVFALKLHFEVLEVDPVSFTGVAPRFLDLADYA